MDFFDDAGRQNRESEPPPRDLKDPFADSNQYSERSLCRFKSRKHFAPFFDGGEAGREVAVAHGFAVPGATHEGEGVSGN